MGVMSHVEKIYYTDGPLPDPSGYEEGDLMFDIPNEDLYVRQGGAWVLIDAPPAIKYYPTYNDVRAATSVLSPMVLVGGRSAVGDGGAGFFVKDNSIAGGDNDGTILVDADGNKWVRVFENVASAKWFLGAGTTYDLSDPAVLGVYQTVYNDHGILAVEWRDVPLTFTSSANFPLGARFIDADISIEGAISTATLAGTAETVYFERCSFTVAAEVRVRVFTNVVLDRCVFESPGVPPTGPNRPTVVVGNGSVAQACSFLRIGGAYSYSGNVHVMLVNHGFVRNSRIEFLVRNYGTITSTLIDIDYTLPNSAWLIFINNYGGASMTACNIKMRFDRRNIQGLVVSGGVVSGCAIGVELTGNTAPAHMEAITLAGGQLSGNTIVAIGDASLGHGLGIIQVNIDNGYRTFLNGNSISWQASPIPFYGIRFHGSWGVERSLGLISGNYFIGNGNGVGIYLRLDAGHVMVVGNYFANMDAPIDGTTTGTHPEVYGNSNVLVGVANSFPAYYTNSTADVIW